MGALAADARAAGITSFVATVCGDNPSMVSILHGLSTSLEVRSQRGEREIVVPLGPSLQARLPLASEAPVVAQPGERLDRDDLPRATRLAALEAGRGSEHPAAVVGDWPASRVG